MEIILIHNLITDDNPNFFVKINFDRILYPGWH